MDIESYVDFLNEFESDIEKINSGINKLLEDYNRDTTNPKIISKITALYFSIKGSNRREIISECSNLSSIELNGILLDWAWMDADKSYIFEGIEFENVFQCEVDDPSTRKNFQREYYCIKNFLPLYNVSTSQNYRYLMKYETPDFIVEDDRKLLGIEVTEMPSSDEIYDENLNNESFMKSLYDRFWNNSITLTFNTFPSFEYLENNKSSVFDWLEKCFDEMNGKPLEEVEYFRSPDEAINIAVNSHSDKHIVVFSRINPPSELDVARELIRRLKKKVRPNRKQPCTNKTIILGYLNGAMFLNKERLLYEIRANIDFEWKNYFEEFWLLISTEAYRVQ